MANNIEKQLKEISERLEQGVKEIFTSERYTEYLNTMSKFHNYSFNNTLLITMQKPEATLVAGYQAWQKKFNRHVKRGEKGIQIIAPAPIREKQEIEKTDPDTGEIVIGEDGQPETEVVERVITRFRVTTVFDVSQTTGEPIPEFEVSELEGDVLIYHDFMEALKMVAPVPIRFIEIDGEAKGFYQLVDKYIDKEVLAYEDSKLEKKYPDFGHLMQEYRDGILLFEISNRQVWDKASKDEEGLDKFFKQNKSNYAWDAPRFRGIILHSSDESVLKEAKKLTKKNPEDEWSNVIRKAFNNDSVTVVKITKGLYAKGDNKYVDKLVFKSGSFEPMKDYPYTATYGKLLKKGPETYKDVRGPVTADYQNYLETAWIKELRDKYSVEIDQEVLKTVNNH